VDVPACPELWVSRPVFPPCPLVASVTCLRYARRARRPAACGL